LILQFHPVFDEDDSKVVAKVVESGWVSEGRFTHEFEEKVAAIMGYRFGVATVNGTVALTLGLMACGIDWHDTISVPDLTFIATANAVRAIGADIKLVDCGEPVDMPVSFNGRTAGAGIVTDAAQALGSSKALSPVASTSFAPSKIITTGQGGMVFTDNQEIAERVRRLKDHGRLDKADFHPSVGFDYKFDDIRAALGLSQLAKLPQRIQHKRRICRQYQEELKGIRVGKASKGELLWYQDIFVKDRDRLMARLLKKGIETRPFYKPLHFQPAYRVVGWFPKADDLSSEGLWLPSSSDLTDEQVTFICDVIKGSLA
jgi:perosamine synthetase